MNRNSLIIIGLSTILAVAAQASQERLATSIREARIEALRTADQLKVTLNSLNALMKQKEGDLRTAYNSFAANVPRTEASRDWTATYLRWMANEGAQYFNDWQKTVEGIGNESIRKKAQRRLDSVRKSYDKVGASLRTAGEKFQPFLSDLKDVQKTLVSDITPGGLKAIKGTVSNANRNFQGVNRAINDALKGMQTMEDLLSTQAK